MNTPALLAMPLPELPDALCRVITEHSTSYDGGLVIAKQAEAYALANLQPLADECERLRAEVVRIQEIAAFQVKAQSAEIDTLRQRVAELEADAGRYRKLLDATAISFRNNGQWLTFPEVCLYDFFNLDYRGNPRAAIDNAIAAGRGVGEGA